MPSGTQKSNLQEKQPHTATPLPEAPPPDAPVYTTFTKTEKHFIIFMVSLGACFSPLSSNIYYPALNTLAADLKVSKSLINLSLTTYMVVQGLAPTLIASSSDTSGRRPAYLFCFVVYIAADIGLALQNDYAALLVLRCVQSGGSSATGALANAVIADIATSAERGSYMGYTFAGAFVCQSLGPVIGGILAEFADWRWIFWFLTIFASVFFVPYLIFVPETCRHLVGNGSIACSEWSMSLINYKRSKDSITVETTEQIARSQRKFRFPNPVSTLRVCLDKEAGMILLTAGLLFAALAAIASGIPSQFQAAFGFNSLQVGLSYIPMGVGSCAAAACMGKLADRNYHRHALRNGFSVDKSHHHTLDDFPIEAARLEVCMPAFYIASATTIAYGWVLHLAPNLGGLLTLLFFIGFSATGAFTVMSTLLIDIYAKSPGTASAANNLVRCFFGAGSSAMIIPLTNRIGAGWSYTFVGLVLVLSSCPILLVMRLGPGWRARARTE